MLHFPAVQRFGRYECIGELASGGMGAVYLGRALGEGGFERLVALKVMHPHLARDAKFRDMFLDEARLAARVRHPNVVSTIDVQRNEDGLFLVMDYIEGPSLHALRRRFTARDGIIPLNIVLRILHDALAGLQAAHELTDDDGKPLGVVHRDVTPQNILVGKDGVTRITDFGVARAASRLVTTQTGQVKGKIPYMAPEQLASDPLDARTDIYALGVTLWEALAGKRLFAADNQAAIVAKVIKGVRQRPSEFNPNLPEPIVNVCMQALSMSADDRPASAAAFADALEHAAEQAKVSIASFRQVVEFVGNHSDLWQTPIEVRESYSQLSAHQPPIELHSGEIDIVPGTAAGTALTPPLTTVSSPRKRLARVGLAACFVVGGLGAWFLGANTASPPGTLSAGSPSSVHDLSTRSPALIIEAPAARPGAPSTAEGAATPIASAAPPPTAEPSAVSSAPPSTAAAPKKALRPRRRWRPAPKNKPKSAGGTGYRPPGL